MPIIKSAQKKLRKDKKRTLKNRTTKDAYKAAVKEVIDLADAGKKISVDLASKAQKTVDKAAKKHLIHQNRAARLKSRVSKLARKK